jgi:hypothetical protein
MKHAHYLLITAVASTFFLVNGRGAAQESPLLPPKEKFHLFLLVGQSNMAGRGAIEADDKKPHPRVLMLNKAGQWVPAVDPLHFDKSAAGVGLGKTFAIQIAEANPGITIGLIPCAVGGSPIDSWKPGALYAGTKSYPWDDTIKRTELALKSGVLKGILWHQGESDSSSALAAGYEVKFHNLITEMRKAFNAADVPFIAGQMGQFEGGAWSEAKKLVDKAHQDLPSKVALTAFVSSEGLKDKGDKTHFDAASYRAFGKRYAEAFLKLTAGKAAPPR